MASHIEQAIAARIAAVRARREQQAADRAALAEQRAHGLTARHIAKLRRLDDEVSTTHATPDGPQQQTTRAASGPGQPRAREDRTVDQPLQRSKPKKGNARDDRGVSTAADALSMPPALSVDEGDGMDQPEVSSIRRTEHGPTTIAGASRRRAGGGVTST